MEISPSTVSPGDRITLQVTLSSDGRVIPAGADYQLLLTGDESGLASALDDHETVVAKLFVTDYKWSTSPGPDMLFASVEGYDFEADGRDAESDPNVDCGSENGKSSPESGIETVAADEGTAESAIESSDADPESQSGDGLADAPSSNAQSPSEEEKCRKTGSKSIDRDRKIEWDPNEPFDERLLQQVINGGQRVPTAEEHVELDYGERTSIEITDCLVELADDLAVSAAVCYRAGELYSSAMRADIVKGKGKFVTAGAAFRLATLIEEEHRPLVAIEAAFDGEITSGEIADKERRMVTELDIDPTIMLIQPQKYLPYLIHILDIDPAAPIVEDARSAAAGASMTGSARSPWSTVVAALYAAGLKDGNQKFNQAEIASVANITEVTIRNNYKDFLEE